MNQNGTQFSLSQGTSAGWEPAEGIRSSRRPVEGRGSGRDRVNREQGRGGTS